MNDAQFSPTSDESTESDNLTGNYATLTLVPAQRETTTIQTITLNTEKNITWVLERLPAGLHEVILVDGRSTDRTIDVARTARPDVRVLLQTARGKGAAVALGLAQVTGDIAGMIGRGGR